MGGSPVYSDELPGTASTARCCVLQPVKYPCTKHYVECHAIPSLPLVPRQMSFPISQSGQAFRPFFCWRRPASSPSEHATRPMCCIFNARPACISRQILHQAAAHARLRSSSIKTHRTLCLCPWQGTDQPRAAAADCPWREDGRTTMIHATAEGLDRKPQTPASGLRRRKNWGRHSALPAAGPSPSLRRLKAEPIGQCSWTGAWL